MTASNQHSLKRFRIRHKLKLKNRNNHKRIYLHVSNKHLNAQLIDDVSGKTLLTVTTIGKEGREKKNNSNKEQAKVLAGEFVKLMLDKKQNPENTYVFDRGNKIYHGKIAAFVEELREKGVKV